HLLECLQRLRDRLGIAILLITHDLRVVREIADQVVVLRHGRGVEDVPVSMFADGARGAYTQMLIDAGPGKRAPARNATFAGAETLVADREADFKLGALACNARL